jgi:metallo-beta-lactamase class B
MITRASAALLAGLLVVAVVPASSEDAISLGPDLSVSEIRPGYWVHVSLRAGDGLPANGMVVRTPKGLLLVDTGWTVAQTEQLLAWGEKSLGASWAEAIVTHSHVDRAGGVSALYARNIRVVALERTVDDLRKGGATRLPDAILSPEAPVHTDVLGFEAFFPGAAHARDNIVVWFPAERILFGGCMIKAQSAGDLGFVGDADLASWPKALDAVKARYASAAVVVPGHGEIGGLGCLSRTRKLLRAAH